jgi:hypothetical protein
MIVPRTPDNVETVIALAVGELCTSTSPRYSTALLHIFASVPVHELNTDENAKGYFVGPQSQFSTVDEAVEHCQVALMLCFHMKALR